MCFSAQASFVASGILGMTGILTYRQVSKNNQLLFASIPLLFAIQQAAEGIVWLSFSHPLFIPWHTIAIYVFLFFAFILWPVFVPLSIYQLENKHPSHSLLFLVVLGSIVSLYLALGLVIYPVQATIFNCHIRYFLSTSTYHAYISSFLYVCATIPSFFCSSIRLMPFFGILCALLYAISYFFYSYAFISVWCFFCAFLSVCVLYILSTISRSQSQS